MATALQRTFGTPTNNKIFTLSLWLKRAAGDINNTITLVQGGGSSRPTSELVLNSEAIALSQYDGLNYNYNVRAYYKARDPSAWYHIVYTFDSTQSTASDRVKFYVNGVIQNYNMQTTAYPSLNYVPAMNGATSHAIGGSVFGSFSANALCLMSHIHFTDGTAYDPTAFGETDSTTGEWKIKTDVSVTYGNNGFFILKDGNSVTDQSGKGNNWTVGAGTLTKTEDSPSNVFCTMNTLSKSLTNVVLSKGNTVVRNDSSANGNVLGTIALGNGKYYWENYKHGGGGPGLGLTLASVDGSNHSAIHGSRVNYYSDGYIYQNGFGLSDINTGVTYGDTDIIGVSVDTENGTIKFYKNGALVANSTQTNSVFTYSQNELIPFWFVINGGEWRTNLGNGYFGTTAVSSAGTNASGNGIFEYDVPTGFTALSTKGLNL